MGSSRRKLFVWDGPGKALALAAGGGVLYFLGFIGFGIWPLVFLFQAVLLVSLDVWGSHRSDEALEFPLVRLGFARAFVLGGTCGFVALCGGYYWVIYLLHTFADLSYPLATLGYLLLNLYQGLVWAVAAGLLVWAAPRTGIHPAFLWPLAVMTAEGFFPLLFPSFVAASFLYVPAFNQIADLGGVYLVDGWIALVNGGLYGLWAWRRNGRTSSVLPGVVAAACTLCVVLYGTVRLREVSASESHRTLTVGVVQANLGSHEKTTRRAEFLVRHQTMTRDLIVAHPEVELIVWPESAFNRAIDRRYPGSVGRFVVPEIPRPVLSGAITVDVNPEGRKVYNSAVLTSSTGAVAGYFDKIYLLNFGETIPLVDKFPWIKRWFPRTGTFDRGTTYEYLKLSDGTRILPMICYEDLVPEMPRSMWLASGAPNVMVNITNDSWYGDSHEPRIHLALSTLRSIENRRPMVRATNTGISAIIDRAGRVVQSTGQWTQETLVGDVNLIEDSSPTLFIRFGPWPVWCSLIFFGWVLMASRYASPSDRLG